MKPRQYLPVHSQDGAHDIWIVIEGRVELYSECGKKVMIKVGDIVIASAREKHSITINSDKDFVMLEITGPTPTGFIFHEEKHLWLFFKTDKEN